MWRSVSGAVHAEAIETVRGDEDGQELSWKVLTPEQNRVIWTFAHQASDGVFFGKLEDLETSWWAGLETETRVAMPISDHKDSRELLDALADDDADLVVCLTTADGLLVEHRERFGEAAKTPWQETFEHALEGNESLDSLPASAREEICFLHGVVRHFGAPSSLARQLVELLHGSFPAHGGTGSASGPEDHGQDLWELGTGLATAGEGQDPGTSHRDLAARFRDTAPEPEAAPD